MKTQNEATGGEPRSNPVKSERSSGNNWRNQNSSSKTVMNCMYNAAPTSKGGGTKSHDQNAYPDIKCYKCDKMGHFAWGCQNPGKDRPKK